MNNKQKIILFLATIGYFIVIVGFLLQNFWVMVFSVVISTSLLIAFNLAGTEKEEAMMTSLELEEAYSRLDTVMAENTQLKAGLAEKDEAIKEAQKKAEVALEDVQRAKEEAVEAFRQSEEYKKQIEEANANTERVREDEQLRTLLPPVEGPGTSEVNVVLLAEETIAEFDSFASKMDIVIRMVAASKTIDVLANKNRLRVMLRNIIDNSLKYMNKAGVLIITISEVGEEVYIVCKDNGLGLSEEETTHIFELNFQGSNRISGNGLGLAQAKAIVDYYKGEIFAKSNEGNGMAIYIKFPKGVEAEVKEEPKSKKESVAELEPETEQEPKQEKEKEPEMESAEEPESEMEPKKEPEEEPEPEKEPEEEPEPEGEIEPEPEVVPEIEQEAEPEAESEAESEAETIDRPGDESTGGIEDEA